MSTLRRWSLSYHYQIYESRWSLTKYLYLACRFGPLLSWPIVMYAFLFDHDMESCEPFVVIVSVAFMLFVCPVLSLLLINSLLTLLTWPHVSPISHAFLSAYLFSVHMQSQAQNAHHCSSIYPASLPISLSSSGMLWTNWHFGKMSFQY